MVVGGTAVGVYGYQRMSAIGERKPEYKIDLDFWYNPNQSNFQRLTQALVELGVDSQELQEIVFDPTHTYLKIPAENFHMDFLCAMQGVESYKACKQRAFSVKIDGNVFFVIGLPDLIKNKQATGRSIDRNDIDELKKRLGKADDQLL